MNAGVSRVARRTVTPCTAVVGEAGSRPGLPRPVPQQQGARMKRTLIGALAFVTFATPTTAAAAPSHMASRCTQYEPLLAQYAPKGGWNVSKMSKIMWRESRCQSSVVNRRGGDTGLLQIHPINWLYLSSRFGVTVNRAWLQNPANNVRAAAALCTFARRAWGSCYRPWAVR